jgi:hypothetical protein
MMALEVISQIQLQIFPPSAGIVGIPEARVLHFLWPKKIETLTLSGFYSYSASPI